MQYKQKFVILRSFQLPDCFCEVMLFIDFGNIPIFTTVEVYGELRLQEDSKNIDDYSLHTPKDLVFHLRDTQLRLTYEDSQNQDNLAENLQDPIKQAHPPRKNEETLNSTHSFLIQKELDLLRKSFKPFIKVYQVRKVLNAKNMIELNLRLRKKLLAK